MRSGTATVSELDKAAQQRNARLLEERIEQARTSLSRTSFGAELAALVDFKATGSGNQWMLSTVQGTLYAKILPQEGYDPAVAYFYSEFPRQGFFTGFHRRKPLSTDAAIRVLTGH